MSETKPLIIPIKADAQNAIQGLQKTARETRLLAQEESLRARQAERDAKLLAKGTEAEQAKSKVLREQAKAHRELAVANRLKTSEANLEIQKLQQANAQTNLSTVGLVAYSIAIGAVTTALTFAVKAYSEYESNLVRMTTLLGDAGIAQSRLNEIITMAANTPFSTAELVESNNIMLAYGLTLTETKEKLNVLGDIASGTGGDLRGLALVVGQINSAGRLMGQDALQLTTRGIPIYKELGKIMGKNATEIKKMGEEGKISAELVNQALDNMTQRGGVFFNAMNMQSITLAGKWSTLWDNITMAAINNTGILMSFLKDTVNKMNRMLETQSSKTLARDIYEEEIKLQKLLVDKQKNLEKALYGELSRLGVISEIARQEKLIAKLKETQQVHQLREKANQKEIDFAVDYVMTLKERIKAEKEGSLQSFIEKERLIQYEKKILALKDETFLNTVKQLVSEKETTATKEEQVKLEKQKTAELEKQDKLKKDTKERNETIKEFGSDTQKLDSFYEDEHQKLVDRRNRRIITIKEFEEFELNLLIDYRRKQEEIQNNTVDKAAPISQKNPYAEELAIQEQQRLADKIAEQKAISTQVELDAEKQKYGVLYGFHQQYIAAKKFLDQTGLSASLAMGEQLMNTADGQSRALFEVGKVLAIGNAVINGIGAVQTTLAQYPFPFSLIPAGIVGGMAALNVAKIASTEYGSTSVDRSIARSGGLTPQTIDLQKDKDKNQNADINSLLSQRAFKLHEETGKNDLSDLILAELKKQTGHMELSNAGLA